MAKKKTTEEFKEQVRAIHGDRYGLDLVEYVNNKVKVKLVCKKHGIFEMTPNCLLSGQNCPQCAKEEHAQKMTKDYDYVIGKFKEMHGDRYCYDKVEYTNMLKKVCITCKEHGDFWMTPAHFIEGHGCPECAKAERSKKRRKNFSQFVSDAEKIHNGKYQYINSGYKNNRSRVKIICPIHGEYTQKVLDHIQGKGCPKCGHVISKAEDKICSFIGGLIGDSNIIRNDRDILDGSEIDIYMPDYKLGIEFNGLHWHTENFGKDRNYHLNKTDKGLSKGIYVIQIFEDEWVEHKEIVLEKIRHFLGKSKCKVIGARKCTIKEVSKDDAKVFLNTYHIQGFVSSTVYLGAYYGNELVGVMTFLKEKEGMWNLTRFATNTNYSLPGLANKMFGYFTKEYNESIIEVKSFLDRRWSFGKTNVYDKMGFKLVEIEKPDYRYVVGNKRMHKFGFRKQRLNKLYGLPLSMTEKEMCEKLGFERIWDCGLYKYVWHNE